MRDILNCKVDWFHAKTLMLPFFYTSGFAPVPLVQKKNTIRLSGSVAAFKIGIKLTMLQDY